MRDARRIHDRVEVRLERMQVIWLTLGVVVALGLVFALGVVVGRRAARLEPAAAEADPIARLDEEGELHQELTFYSRLTEPEAEARVLPPARERPAAPVPGTGVAAVPSTREAAARSAPEAPVATAARVADTAATSASPAPAPAAPADPSPADPAPAAPASTDAELTAALARGPARPGEYTVQVSSFQTAEEARAYAGSLERKGFRPFVVSAEIAGRGTWYRVRLGSFADEETAKSAKMLLARSDIPAWVLRTE